MIKQIEAVDSPFDKKGSKLKQFFADLKEIVDNRIEYSEFVDFYYADSTSVADLEYKARCFCRQKLYDEIGKSPKRVDFFKFAKVIKGDKPYFYAKFDVNARDEAVKGE